MIQVVYENLRGKILREINIVDNYIEIRCQDMSRYLLCSVDRDGFLYVDDYDVRVNGCLRFENRKVVGVEAKQCLEFDDACSEDFEYRFISIVSFTLLFEKASLTFTLSFKGIRASNDLCLVKINSNSAVKGSIEQYNNALSKVLEGREAEKLIALL